MFQRLKQTESEKLQVQIQAYLDNVLDVGALLEDAENRGGMLLHVDDLQEHNAQVGIRNRSEEEALFDEKRPWCCEVNVVCVAAERPARRDRESDRGENI